MNKGVVDQRASSSGASAGGAVRASTDALPPPLDPEAAAGPPQRRRRRQRRHELPERHPGNGRQVAVITLVAIAVLFLILYALLPREKTIREEPQSSVAPGSALPCPGAGSGDLSRLFARLVVG